MKLGARRPLTLPSGSPATVTDHPDTQPGHQPLRPERAWSPQFRIRPQGALAKLPRPESEQSHTTRCLPATADSPGDANCWPSCGPVRTFLPTVVQALHGWEGSARLPLAIKYAPPRDRTAVEAWERREDGDSVTIEIRPQPPSGDRWSSGYRRVQA